MVLWLCIFIFVRKKTAYDTIHDFSVWLRTRYKSADINRFRSHTGIIFPYIKVTGCLSVCLCVPTDLGNSWNDIVLLYSDACHRSREGSTNLQRYNAPRKNIPNTKYLYYMPIFLITNFKNSNNKTLKLFLFAGRISYIS